MASLSLLLNFKSSSYIHSVEITMCITFYSNIPLMRFHSKNLVAAILLLLSDVKFSETPSYNFSNIQVQ